MTELKPYPKYKDSGVEWIGEIPEDWEVLKFTRGLYSIVDYRGKTPEKVDSGIFLVTARNIKNGKIDYDYSKEYVKKEDYNEIMSRGKPEISDVLFTTEAPLGEVANVDNPNIALAQRIIKFSGKKDKLNNYFLKYWMNSRLFQDDLQRFATGSTAQGIKASKLGELKLILPSVELQYKIVNFLDDKTLEIDSLISDKERLIELLEEKRQAIITETVTKGLNPNVKMKDSGIEWIGEIPEHWEVSKIKFTSNKSLVYGANESALDNEKEGVRYIRITDIDSEGNLRDDTKKTLPINIAEKYPVIYGDILFARSGATVGKTYIHETEERACYAGYLIKYTANPARLLSKFLYYYTQSQSYSGWVREQLIQATIENISAEKYANMLIPLPNLQEQYKVIEYLNAYNVKHKNIQKKVLEQISKLKEYRESLIYEAVTGKIDLREVGD